MIIKECFKCKNKIKLFPSKIKRSKSKRFFCSSNCFYSSQIGHKTSKITKDKIRKTLTKGKFISCLICNKDFWVIPKRFNKAKFCSFQCYWKSMKGKRIPYLWKGGKYKSGNYICIYQPNHPFVTGKYILEHRFVMEKHLGRYLMRKESVHHINGNHSDNRIENLKLFPNESEHQKYHHSSECCKELQSHDISNK